MQILRILSLVIIGIGFLTVFASKTIVDKYKLNEGSKCNFEHEMSEEELARYKYDKAVVNLKMLGMLIALPGFILLFFSFR